MRSTLLLAILSVSAAASAQQLLGASSGTPGSIYSIDSTTGAATHIVDVNSGGGSVSITDIEVHNGKVYISDVFEGTGNRFGYVDLNTGLYTGLSDQGGSYNWFSLAANTALDVLYTVDYNAGNMLTSIDPTTGTPTQIGSVCFYTAGMTYDNGAGVLYAIDTGFNLYTIDESTGASTLVGATNISGVTGFADIAWDSDAGKLYFNHWNGQQSMLYELDTATGNGTFVGLNNAFDVNGTAVVMDGLAYQPVPEPASMVAIGMGLATVLRRRRK